MHTAFMQDKYFVVFLYSEIKKCYFDWRYTKIKYTFSRFDSLEYYQMLFYFPQLTLRSKTYYILKIYLNIYQYSIN